MASDWGSRKMNFNELVETIGAANTAMLEAADEGRWDDFILIAGARESMVGTFKSALDEGKTVTGEARIAAVESLSRIVAEYADIEAVIKARMGALENAANTLGNTGKIEKYYEFNRTA